MLFNDDPNNTSVPARQDDLLTFETENTEQQDFQFLDHNDRGEPKDIINSPALVATNSLYASMAQQAIVDGKIDAGKMILAFDRIAPIAGGDDGYKLMRKSIASLRAQGQYEAINSVLKDYITNLSSDKAAEFAKSIPILNEQVELEEEQSDSVERAIAQAIGPTDGMTKGQILRAEKAISKMYANDVISKMVDKEGYFEVISNYAGFMLSDVNIDARRWLESNDVNTADALRDTILSYKRLSAADQIRVFPDLAEAILEAADDNERKAAARLTQFITPGGEHGAQVEAYIDAGALATDIFAAGALAKGVFKMVKAHRNMIKVSEQLGKGDVAADSAVAAILDPEIAAKLGTSQEEAATMAMGGTKINDVNDVTTISEKILDSFRKLELKITEMMNPNNPLFGEVIRSEDIAKMSEAINKQWKSLNYPGFRNVGLERTTRLGTDIVAEYGTLAKGEAFLSRSGANKRMKALKKEGTIEPDSFVAKTEEGFIIKSTVHKDFKITDVGEFKGATAAGTIETAVGSANFYMSKLDEATNVGDISISIASATRIELQSAVAANLFNNMAKAALKPIGNILIPFTQARRSLKKIDQILTQGDNYLETLADGTIKRGKVYTISELREGITVKGEITVALEPNEIESYFALRRVFDWMYVLKNDGVKKGLNLRNYKNVVVDELDTTARQYDTAIAAGEALSSGRISHVYDYTTKKLVRVDSLKLEEMYNSGFKIMKPQNTKRVGGADYKFVKVSNENISELPQNVLIYKKGYVPKIYDKGFYFVKQDIRGTVDGAANQLVSSRTLRMFGSKKSAITYLEQERKIQQLGLELVNKTSEADVSAVRKLLADEGLSRSEIDDLAQKAIAGEIDPGNLRWVADRELSADKSAGEANGFSGGLYTGRRAQHDILYGVDGEVPTRLTAFESLQRNIQHISNYYPRNEWRMAMQERWMNTARAMNAIDPGKGFIEASKAIQKPHGSRELASLKASANWIKDQARIPTPEEEWFGRLMKGWAEWAEEPIDVFGTRVASAKLPEAARHSLLNLSNKDPYSAARAAAFHPLLGWFNPVQLFVQAQGFSIAASLHPSNFMNGMKGGFGLTTTAFSENATYIRRVGKALGYKADDFELLQRNFRKSGLVDSIKATADHAATAQGYGLTLQAIKKVADKGLMFYRRGEMFTRSYAYQTATDLFLKANAKKTIRNMTDEDWAGILDKAIDITFNMTRANRAAWQKGILSLPTQFMQIQAKWIEALWPKAIGGTGKLSPSQKMKFMGIQFGIYGSAGIPFGNLVTEQMASWLELNESEIPIGVKKYARDGFFGTGAMFAFGANSEIGGRGAIARGVVDTMYAAIFEQGEMFDMLGAFGNIPKGVYNAVGALKPLVYNPQDITWTPQEAVYFWSELAKIGSGWRNVTKAVYMARANEIIDSKGRRIVDRTKKGGFSAGTIALQAAGFQATEGVEAFIIRDINKIDSRILNDVATSIISHFHNYLGGIVGTLNHARSAENAAIMTKGLLEPLDEIHRKEVMTIVRRRLNKEGDLLTKELKKFLDRYGQETTTKIYQTVLKPSRIKAGGLGPSTITSLSPEPEGTQ